MRLYSHLGVEEDVGTLAVFFAVLPPARVDVFIGVGEHTFSVLLAVFPEA